MGNLHVVGVQQVAFPILRAVEELKLWMKILSQHSNVTSDRDQQNCSVCELQPNQLRMAFAGQFEHVHHLDVFKLINPKSLLFDGFPEEDVLGL